MAITLDIALLCCGTGTKFGAEAPAVSSVGSVSQRLTGDGSQTKFGAEAPLDDNPISSHTAHRFWATHTLE